MRPTALLTALLLVSSPALAESAADFDRPPKDQLLDNQELTAWLIHRGGIPFAALDLNKDGQLDQEEIDSGPGQLLREMQQSLGKPPPYTADEADRWMEKRSGGPTIKLPINLLVRGAPDVVTISDPVESFKTASPALFSYSRDFRSDTNTWLAKGTVLMPFRVCCESPTSVVTAVSLTPSISFDRLSSEKDKSKEQSALIFRAQTESELTGVLDGQLFRAFLSYATDFKFDTKIAAAELEWEPIWLRAGIGVFHRVAHLDFLEYRWRPVVHGEYGYTFANGDSNNLSDDEDFLRLGPRLNLALRPSELHQLVLSATCDYLGGLIGRPHDSYHVTAGVSWSLDPAGHFAVTMQYERGETPLVKDDVDNISLGLSVKF